MSLYIRSQKGFGNKIVDLLTAIYLKRRYGIDVFLVMNDNKFPKLLSKSSEIIGYISNERYLQIRPKSLLIKSFDDLPDKISRPTTLIGMERFMPHIYPLMQRSDLKYPFLNPKVIDRDVLTRSKQDYACVNIRYDRNLCASIQEGKSHTLLYSPNYYRDQIEALLATEIEMLYVITEAKDLVQKYVLDEFTDPRIVLADYSCVDLFYLMVHSHYLVLSHNLFSFAAAYLNLKGIKYLLVPEGTEMDTDWEVIKEDKYLMNDDSKIAKEMAYDYGDCDRYLSKVKKMQSGSSRLYPQAYFIDQGSVTGRSFDSLTLRGPVSLSNVIVNKNLMIEGSLRFSNIWVKSEATVLGSVYGTKCTITDLKIEGEAHLDGALVDYSIINGSLVAINSIFRRSATLIGNNYLSFCSINLLQLFSKRTAINNCKIHTLVILNTFDPISIQISNCNINRIVSNNIHVTIYASITTKIKYAANVSIVIDKTLR